MPGGPFDGHPVLRPLVSLAATIQHWLLQAWLRKYKLLSSIWHCFSSGAQAYLYNVYTGAPQIIPAAPSVLISVPPEVNSSRVFSLLSTSSNSRLFCNTELSCTSSSGTGTARECTAQEVQWKRDLSLDEAPVSPPGTVEGSHQLWAHFGHDLIWHRVSKWCFHCSLHASGMSGSIGSKVLSWATFLHVLILFYCY